MEGMDSFVKVGTKGEFIVPKIVREDLKIHPGNILKVMEVDNMLIVKKVDTAITDKEALLVREISKALNSKGNIYSKDEYVKILKARIAKNESRTKA